MREAGDVLRADIFKNERGESKGLGMVEFKVASCAYKAKDMFHGKEFEGRKIYIKMDSGDTNGGQKFSNSRPAREEFRGGLANRDGYDRFPRDRGFN